MKPPETHVLRHSAWSTLRRSLHWVYTAEIPPDGWGIRTNPHLCVWWVHEGRAGVEFSEHRKAEARPGEWLVVPSGDRNQSFLPGTILTSLCIIAHWPDGSPLLEEGLPVSFSRAEAEPMKPPARLLHDLVRHEVPLKPGPRHTTVAGSRISAQVFFQLDKALSSFIGVLLEALEAKGVRPVIHPIQDPRILNALNILDHTPLHSMRPLARIAEEIALSPGQMNRLFKQYVGHTPKVHLQLRKLEEAKALLRNEQVSLKEVAYELGFPSQSAFANWCTKYLGGSPRKIRRQPEDSTYESSVIKKQPLPEKR